ncbi:ABC transporter permease [Planococcus lenghuensis]|uniref:ABC transporter permease n=1 Tax=Planococcus lenghuensis TaxID=2213202 RepID=A0A1Q2L085_9BACL|nr:ABC transporter permease subunit [Planococcus lenghuensis]AQQ53858.1 ABC transporter permease [Planococcus lenghuensis]
MRVILINPVLIKELKLRFRNAKSFVGVLFYLLAMSIFVFGFIYLQTAFSGNGFFRPADSIILFMMISFIQLGLILFITPGLTAGAISTEREKQTLNILLTTSQTSFQIIFGKLTSSVVFLLLLIIAGLPIYSLVFLYGGVSPGQVFMILMFDITTLLAFGSVGVMYSTVTRRTIVSMISTYGTMVFFAGMTAFFLLLSLQFNNAAGLYPENTVSPLSYFLGAINPVIVLLSLLEPQTLEEVYGLTGIRFPLWVTYVIFYSLLTAAALLVAVKTLRVNMHRYK